MINAIAALMSVALAGAGSTAPRCTEVAPARDYVYTFVVTDESEKKSSGTVRVHGDRTRIDMDGKDHPGDYILLTDGGTRMLSVHPDRKEVNQINSQNFAHIIGTSLRAVSPLVKFTVANSKISFARVGTGEKVLGYATEQIRVNESFDIHIRAMGFDGGTEHHTIVTDYWVSPGLDLGSNPLLALIEHTGTAMAQSDRDFVSKEETVRAAALQGTPLRTVVHETSVDNDPKHKGKGAEEKTHSIDITSVKMEAQPAAMFEVPSGYRIKSGVNIDI